MPAKVNFQVFQMLKFGALNALAETNIVKGTRQPTARYRPPQEPLAGFVPRWPDQFSRNLSASSVRSEVVQVHDYIYEERDKREIR